MLDQLNKLARELLRNHSTIDCGGCCVVAAQMAKYLSHLVPVQIVTGNGSWSAELEDTLDDIRPHINSNNKYEWEENGVHFSHVLIEFEYDGTVYAFDSTHGVRHKEEYWSRSPWTRLEGSFLQEEAESFAKDNSWNEMFDRAEVPIVRRRITNFFKKHFPAAHACVQGVKVELAC